MFPEWVVEYGRCYMQVSPHATVVDCSSNVMAHGDAREGKWRGNWRMEWVASTLHTTSEHGVSSITTADAHTSAASSRLNCYPAVLNRLVHFFEKRIWFLRVCHHVSNAVLCRVSGVAGDWDSNNPIISCQSVRQRASRYRRPCTSWMSHRWNTETSFAVQ